MKSVGKGQVAWDSSNDTKTTTISFTAPEMKFLKDRIVEMDKQKKIPDNLLDVAIKIQDINLDK